MPSSLSALSVSFSGRRETKSKIRRDAVINGVLVFSSPGKSARHANQDGVHLEESDISVCSHPPAPSAV